MVDVCEWSQLEDRCKAAAQAHRGGKLALLVDRRSTSSKNSQTKDMYCTGRQTRGSTAISKRTASNSTACGIDWSSRSTQATAAWIMAR